LNKLGAFQVKYLTVVSSENFLRKAGYTKDLLIIGRAPLLWKRIIHILV